MGNMPATQHAWYGAGVVGMSPYTQGMLPLGVGGAAGVFQYMRSTGEGWRVFPLAAQYSTHGAPQAGYTLAASSPPWDVAAGRHDYEADQRWLSRMPSHYGLWS